MIAAGEVATCAASDMASSTVPGQIASSATLPGEPIELALAEAPRPELSVAPKRLKPLGASFSLSGGSSRRLADAEDTAGARKSGLRRV